MMQTLAENLTQAGERVESWQSPDASSALVLEHGGRIIGLYTPGRKHNLLWTHPALEAGSAATKVFLRGEQWHNSGGQRTWLSPEREFFLPKYPRRCDYHQPRQLDPGSYQLSRTGEGVHLGLRCTLDHRGSGSRIEVEIEKLVKGADDPLRSRYLSKLDYAGVTVQTSLSFCRPPAPSVKVSLWSLLQLRHGGKAIVPTLSKANPVKYFGNIEEDSLRVNEHSVWYRMSAAGKQKIGFEAYNQTGRMGYLQQDERGASLVVVNCQVNPSKDYVDVPWRYPDAPACPVQLCNFQGELGSFAELEHHSPASDSDCRDEFQIWSYSGSAEAVNQAAYRLLGYSPQP